jgi:hypothetical protein
MTSGCQESCKVRRGRVVKSRYRVWIVRYEGPRPPAWHDVPAGAVAVEPAERRTMSSRQARHYVEAFNRATEASQRKVWAVALPVALPVAVRYVGDPQPGEPLSQAS